MQNVNQNYEILIGVEEEVFIVNPNGFLAPFAEHVAEKLLNIIRRDKKLLEMSRHYLKGLQWEPNPSQLEYVTRPHNIQEIIKAIKFARELLAKAANSLGLYILPISVHPIESRPFPINGTHINISILREKKPISRNELVKIFNHIRNHLPELIAISANSEILNGGKSKYKSSRLAYSRVLKESKIGKIERVRYHIRPRRKREITRYGILFEKYRNKEMKIIVNETGDRLLDIVIRGPYTNILEDSDKTSKESRIEIRAIDNQINIEHLYDIIKIIAALALEALTLDNIPDEHPYLGYNREKAIENGINAKFLNENGEEIDAKESFLKMLKRLTPFLEKMRVKLNSSISRGEPEIENSTKIEIRDTNNKLTNLEKRGVIFVEIKTKEELKAYNLFGKLTKIQEGETLSGILVPHYEILLEKEDGIIKRIMGIKINHWLVADTLYIPLTNNIIIKKHRGPVRQLYNKLKNII